VPSKLSRILWTTLATIVAMVIVAFLLGTRLASNKIAVAQAGWEQTLGSREEIMERFPPRGANEAALELERLTARLGIDIATRTEDARPRPSKEAARRYNRIKAKLGSYLERQVEQPRRAALPPPEQLIGFLGEEEENLAAIRRHLLEGELPRWELWLDPRYTTPFPNLLGHIDLQKLMIAEALVKNGRGEGAVALAALEASWRLNSAIRDDPYLITQLVAIAVTRLQVGALRQMEEVPAHWQERLVEHDFRGSFFMAMLLESWLWTQIEGSEIFETWLGRMERLAWTFTRPYADYCFADLSDDFRRRLLTLAESGATCDYHLSDSDAGLDIPVPFWNVMGDLVKPNLLGTLDRLARLELDLELTGRVLALESAIWDESVEQSSACPRDNWLYEAGPDGSMSIRFSREISWQDQIGAILPTRFSVGRATSPTPTPR
jgi:hypothetical protein